jgi:hypothetical protein
MAKSCLCAAASAFVLLFAATHLMDATHRREVCEEGYFATLTIYTLLLTAYALALPTPPIFVSAVLGVNVVVCAVYYAVVNQSHVSGTSFLLHGGCALVLAACVWSDTLACGGHPAAAFALSATLLLGSSVLQLWDEGRRQKQLYPSCRNFGNPLWRLLVLPIIGGAAAALIARAARS